MPRRRKNGPDHAGLLALRGDARACVRYLESDDVTYGLRACQELLNLVSLHEERLIRLARTRGLSWHAIAFYLGVRYQTVHRKWRRRLQGDAYDPKSGRRKDEWIQRYGPS